MARPHLAPTLALLAGACYSPFAVGDPDRHSADPTVVVHGPGGDELGVSTDYGVVFLGRGAKSGMVEFTAWFGDGPSREQGAVEAISDQLCVTEAEIEIPSVAIAFVEPAAGTRVLVRGRRNGALWERWTTVASDPSVEGLLLAPTSELSRLQPEEVGAGVFWFDENGLANLLGLISGSVRLEGEGGARTYVAALGPRELWRLVVQRRNSDRPRRWVYREDIR